MIWIIASIPFWIIGAFFALAAPVSIIKRQPDETPAEIGSQFLLCLLVSGIFLLIAAKTCS